MKQISLNPCQLQALLLAALLAAPATVLADPAAECRQEVQDYGIPPEQAQDYLEGCILSRGGALEPDPGAAVPGEETTDVFWSQEIEHTDGQVFDAGQPDAILPGGPDGAY